MASAASSSSTALQHRGFSSAKQQQLDTPASTAATAAVPAAAAADSDDLPPNAGWWERWTHERPMPDRWTPAWWREMALIFVVFGITGSSSMYVVRPMLRDVAGLEGSFRDGPWSYRLITCAVLMPAYSLMLVTFGTIAGRHHYFRRVALRMWGRLLPLHKLGIVSKAAPKPRPTITATPGSSTSSGSTPQV